MLIAVRNTILSNLPLKVASLILGYAFWYMLGQSCDIVKTVNVPVCFYNVTDETTIDAPENVNVELVSKRSNFRRINTNQLALHYDAQAFGDGQTPLSVTQEKLLLPEQIRVVNWAPSKLFVTVSKTAN